MLPWYLFEILNYFQSNNKKKRQVNRKEEKLQQELLINEDTAEDGCLQIY